MTTPRVRSGSSGSGPGTLRCPSCNALYAPPLENCPSCGLELPRLESAVGPGAVIDDKYEVISLLGAGGMGEVYKARHVHLNAIRTIKVLKPGLLSDTWFRNRFLREARLATQLNHVNLAVVHDFSIQPNGSCYMVSEFVDGLTVRQWIKRFGRFPLGLAVEVVSQVLSGLAYCHRRGLLHRDISPDNIMITVDSDDQPAVKIIDLGIAKQLGGRPADATQTGLFVGNPKYCSPEQLGHLEQGEEIDARADMYSLGVTLYEMVAGAAPFRSNTPQGYLIKHLTQAPPSFDETDPGLSIPETFQRVVFKVLEKERSRRYSSAEEFAAALRPFRADISRGLEATFGITLRETGAASGSAGDEGRSTTKIASKPAARPSVETERAADYVQTKELQRGTSQKSRREEEARQEESRALALVRDLEGRRDLQALEALAASWPVDSKVAREAAGAIGRVRVDAVREKRETEARDWERAWKDGGETVWQEFLDRHGDSPRRSQAARHQAEARDLQKALRSQSQDEWQEFLRSWPDGRFREQVEAKIEQARAVEAEEFDRAQELGTAQAFREFLTRHPTSFLTSIAQTFLEEQTEFEGARAADTLQAWDHFLEKWPSGRNSATAIARRRLADEREEQVLAEATKAGTSTALGHFLERHPASPRRERADALFREAVAWERSKGRGRGAMDEFLSKYPEGVHAEAARAELQRMDEENQLQKVAQLEKVGDLVELDRIARSQRPSTVIGAAAKAALERLIDRDWKKASKDNTEAAWEHFLRNHATSSYAGEARRKLENLRSEREEQLRAEQRAAREREEKKQAELAAEQEERERKRTEARAEREREQRRQAELAAERERERLVSSAWREASKEDSENSWARFLEAHAASPRAEDARRRLSELQREREEEQKTRALSRESMSEGKTERLSLGGRAPAPLPEGPAAPGVVEEAARVERAVLEPVRRRAGRAVGIALAAVAVVVVTWLAVSRNRALEKGVAGRAAPAAETPAPRPVEAGLVAVDALPWGRVERIQDGNGKDWLKEQSYTPLAIAVPPGRYSIRLTSANFPGRTITLTAEVRSGEIANCQGRFDVLDARTYFDAEGWR